MITNTAPQRELRSPKPPRPVPRAKITDEHHAVLARRLTDRDRWLVRMLHEHRVLTSTQVAELAFPRRWAANRRLLRLYQWRVVDRFQPHARTGVAPMHYVLDTAGARVLADEHGLDLSKIGYRHDRAVGIAYSLTLAHTVAVNGFFTALVAASRRDGATGRLRAWWSERRCYQHWGDIVRPDGYGRYADHHGELEFFLEYDTGTEPLGTLASKLHSYARLAAISGITTPVLFVLPTAAREANARQALHTTLRSASNPAATPVATAALDATTDAPDYDPAEPRWLPLAPAAGRRGLTALAATWSLHSRQAARPAPANAQPPSAMLPPPPMPPTDSTAHPWR